MKAKTRKDGWLGLASSVLSCVVVAGMLWLLTPHPRSYTVAANSLDGAERIATAEAWTVVHRSEASERATP